MIRCRRGIGWLLPALLAASSAVADEQIGRLFSTPDERARLDMLRSGLVQEMALNGTGADGGESVVQPAEPLYLNGLIRRSDGRTTVWINGQRLDQHGGTDELTLRSPVDRENRVRLRLNRERRTVRLKPGQAWDPAVKQVVERFRIEKKEPESGQTPDVTESGSDPGMMGGS